MFEIINFSPSNLDFSCVSSSLAFLMMYSVYKLNKQGDNIQSYFVLSLESTVCCTLLWELNK